MSKEQVAQFRQKFRAEVIPGYYNGWLHLFFNGGVLIALCAFLLWQVESPSGVELLTIPVTLLLGNLAVYCIHRFPLHHSYKLIDKHTYNIHSRWHHQFYTNEYVIFDEINDFYILFFPPTVILLFSVVYIPANYFILKNFLPPNVLFLYLFTSALYFVLYEIFHFVSHLREDHPLLKFPLFGHVWKHHVDHHNTRLMHDWNFNIVFPFFDHVFGTTWKGEKETK